MWTSRSVASASASARARIVLYSLPVKPEDLAKRRSICAALKPASDFVTELVHRNASETRALRWSPISTSEVVAIRR
jgi:hypothetical protein